MKTYQRKILIFLAVIILLIIMIMLLIHTFNHTEEDGEYISTTSSFYIRGD
jgi:uncharacterized protein YxeA